MNKAFEEALSAAAVQPEPAPLSKDQRSRILDAAAARIRGQEAAEPGRTAVPVLHLAQGGRKAARHGRRPLRALPRRLGAMAAAAAVTASLAVAAAAAGGITGNFWQALFPAARGTTSEDQSLVLENVAADGGSAVIDGCTVTVLNHMTDTNGNGCVYFSVENPAGVQGFFTEHDPAGDAAKSYNGSADVELSAGSHAVLLVSGDDGMPCGGRLYRDAAASTDTCIYVYSYFTSADGKAAQKLSLLVDRAAADSNTAAPQPVQIALTDTVPLAAAEIDTSPNMTVDLSAVGLTLRCKAMAPSDMDYTRDAYRALEFTDGTRYVMWDEASGLHNYGYVCGSDGGSMYSWVYNRVVDPSLVAAVWVNGERIPVQ